MIKQLFLLTLLIDPLIAMEFPSSISEQPSQKQRQEALERYKQSRDSLYCDQCFFSKDHSEQEKETYFETFKKLYYPVKREACIGCSICIAETATACTTATFICDTDFCCTHPMGWALCCLLQVGTTWGLTRIADKVQNDFIRYWNEKRRMERAEAVVQLRPIQVQVKVIKVE